jgi:hypothetical protein
MMTRAELEEEFCRRLSDDLLGIAAKSHFDALLLWHQRDLANALLAINGLSIYGELSDDAAEQQHTNLYH